MNLGCQSTLGNNPENILKSVFIWTDPLKQPDIMESEQQISCKLASLKWMIAKI